MKKLSFLLIILIITSLVAGLAISCGGAATTPAATTPASPAKAVVLRVAAPWPPGDPPTEEIKKMAEKFNARTGGRYIMEVHPGEELVKVQESLDAARTKAVELAGYPTGVFSSVDPRMAAAEVPFLYTGIKAETTAQASLVPMYNEFLPQKFNQRMLGSFACLPLEYIGNKEVKTLEDFRGLLVQSVSPLASQVIEALGGSPVAAPFVEGYIVLQKKTVDATMASGMFAVTFKLHEVAKYMTLSYCIPAAICLVINMDVYNSLPSDIRAIMDEEGANFTKSANDLFATLYDQDNRILAEQGIKVYKLPPEERARWQSAVAPVKGKTIGDMGEWGQRLLKIADEVNAKYPY